MLALKKPLSLWVGRPNYSIPLELVYAPSENTDSILDLHTVTASLAVVGHGLLETQG